MQILKWSTSTLIYFPPLSGFIILLLQLYCLFPLPEALTASKTSSGTFTCCWPWYKQLPLCSCSLVTVRGLKSKKHFELHPTVWSIKNVAGSCQITTITSSIVQQQSKQHMFINNQLSESLVIMETQDRPLLLREGCSSSCWLRWIIQSCISWSERETMTQRFIATYSRGSYRESEVKSAQTDITFRNNGFYKYCVHRQKCPWEQHKDYYYYYL